MLGMVALDGVERSVCECVVVMGELSDCVHVLIIWNTFMLCFLAGYQAKQICVW